MTKLQHSDIGKSEAAGPAEEGTHEKDESMLFSGDITRSGGTERAACMIANGLVAQKDYEVCVLSLVEQAARKRPFFIWTAKFLMKRSVSSGYSRDRNIWR